MPEVLYCQRNYGGTRLGTCDDTDRGLYGCYLTSVAMMYTHYNWTIDPAQLDDEFTARGIYYGGCLLYPQAPVNYHPQLGLEASYDYSSAPADLNQLSMDLEQEIIVRVDGFWWGLGYPTHFLRVWSWDGSTCVLADPWTGELRSLSAGDAARAITGIDRYRLPGFRPDWGGGGEPPPPPTPEPPPGSFQVSSRGSNIRTAPSTSEGAVVRTAAEGEQLTVNAGVHAEAVPDYGYSDPGAHPNDIWWNLQDGGWVADGAVEGFPPSGWNNWVDWNPDPPPIVEPPPPPTDYGPPLMSSYIDPGATWHPLPAENFTLDRRDRIETGEVIGESYDLKQGGGLIVLHHMDGTMQATDNEFLRPGAEKSAHYGIAQDGSKVQWVDEKDAAYHAGNYQANRLSIGIEHEDLGKDSYTDQQYEASAEVVANVCRRYSIPCQAGKWVADATPTPGVIRHSDVVATACPGQLDVARIISRANEILDHPGPTPPPKHPEGSTDQATADWLNQVANWLKQSA